MCDFVGGTRDYGTCLYVVGTVALVSYSPSEDF